MERNQKKLKRILPKRDDPSEAETNYLMSDQWDEKPSLSKRVHVKMILPNFRVKGRSVYFILEPQMWVVMDKIYIEDQFIMDADGSLISVQYRLYTEEDPRGLRCEVMICDEYNLYHGDYQFIGKLVEMNILGINPEKKYQLMDFRYELSKKKKMKKIPQIQHVQTDEIGMNDRIVEKPRKRIVSIEDED